MDIDVVKSGRVVKIVIDGSIDTDGGAALSANLAEIMDMPDVGQVVFDLTTVKSITSSGIGKLMNFFKFLDAKKGKMEIKGISDSLYKQFMEIHLDRIFPISKK